MGMGNWFLLCWGLVAVISLWLRSFILGQLRERHGAKAKAFFYKDGCF